MPRILIADDSELSRAQLAAIIRRQDGWTVCGETRNGLKAVLLARELKPDLVILDLVMPMLDGLTASAEIAKLMPSVPIVIYSVEILTELEMEAKKFGVWALMSKTASEDELIETLNRLLAAPDTSLVPDPNEAGATSGLAKEAGSEPQIDLLSEAALEPD